MSQKIAIIGAGISGLTQAWKLHVQFPDQTDNISVFEADTRPGGSAWSERIDGFLVEYGPNGFLDNRLEIMNLANEVGITTSLNPADKSAKKRFVWDGHRLSEVPLSIVGFLGSRLLSWRGKLRLISERFRRPLHQVDESIYEFAVRRFGVETADQLVDPFVTGIFAGDTKLLSLRACLPTLFEWEKNNGSILRTALSSRLRNQSAEPKVVAGSTKQSAGRLTAPRDGMRTLIEALAGKLGTSLQLRRTFINMERKDTGYRLIDQQGQTHSADVVILACPAHQQSKLLHSLAPQLADELNAIAYSPAVVASIGYRRKDLPAGVQGFGYLSPQRMKRPVLGVIFTSSIFPHHSPDDQFQFRAILGGWHCQEVVSWTDEQIMQAVRRDLKDSLGITATPTFQWVHRWARAIPQYHVGHLARLQRIDSLLANLPGIYLIGNSFRGVSLNDCVKDAIATTPKIAEYLKNRSGENS